MSKTLISAIHAELGWTWRDTVGQTTIVNSNRLRSLDDLADGTGVDQADVVWHVEQQTLAAANSITLELDSLAQSVFGNTISLSLATVKAILVVNTSSTGGYLLIGGAAADEWHELFAASGDKVKVMSGGKLLLANPGGGWSVAAGSTDLKIEAISAEVTYDIAILGTSL